MYPMKRSERSVTQRKRLVRVCVENPKAGAILINSFANKMNKANGTNETVKILADMLGISETTVFRDFSN